MNQKNFILIGATVCSFFTAINPASAQRTAFTYPGRLDSSGNPGLTQKVDELKTELKQRLDALEKIILNQKSN